MNDTRTASSGDEKTKGYDHELVWEACNALDAEGIKPTYQAVRQKLGGKGSFSYIAAGMKSWTPPRAVPVPDLPEDMVERVKSFTSAVWQSATAAARAEFAIERESHLQRIGELETAVVDYETDLKALNAEVASLLQQKSASDTRMAELEQQVIEQRGKIAVFEQLASGRGSAKKPSRRGIKPSLVQEDTPAPYSSGFTS
jgi:uncharacterized coiled-coil protein SlyX